MRIISKFKDFYDIGLGLGYDDSIKFVRETIEVSIKKDKVSYDLVKSLPKTPSGRGSIAYDVYVIGFCGKFYPVVVLYGSMYGPKPIYCYSVSEIDKHVQSFLSKKEYQYYRDEGRWGRRHTFIKMFELYEALPTNLEPFIAKRSPIVVLNEWDTEKGSKAIWNARLNNYNFEKFINPYEAFQAVAMFIANLASPEKPIPPRSDKLKVQSHGFDEWSFRKKGVK